MPTRNQHDYEDFFEQVLKYHFFAVCVPPFYVERSKQLLNDSPVQTCTVIGFPNGYNETETKIFETEQALKKDCDEIDMVANLYDLKSANWSNIENEITQIKKVCDNKVLKVIVESSLLEDNEIVEISKVIMNSGADYIKTSTGFHGPGAKLEHIALMKETLKNSNVKIKASGGIRDLEAAKKFIAAGCSRIGTSSGVNIMNEYLGNNDNETTARSDY